MVPCLAPTASWCLRCKWHINETMLMVCSTEFICLGHCICCIQVVRSPATHTSMSAKAAATAYVLLGLVVPKLVGGERNNMPVVLQKAGCWKLPAGLGCLRDGACFSFKSMTQFFTSSFASHPCQGLGSQWFYMFIILYIKVLNQNQRTIVAGPLGARNSGLCVSHLQRWVL